MIKLFNFVGFVRFVHFLLFTRKFRILQSFNRNLHQYRKKSSICAFNTTSIVFNSLTMETIKLDKQLIIEKLSANDYDFVIKLLKDEFKLSPAEGRGNIPQTKIPTEETIDVLEYLFETVRKNLPNLKDEEIKMAHQCFHSLRNCVVSVHLDVELAEKTILGNTFEILKYLLKDDRKISKECLKKLLQCLCNAINVNKGFNYDVWENYPPLFIDLLKEKEAISEAIILMNNIFSFFDFAIPTDLEYLTNVLDLYDSVSDVQLLLEKIIAYSGISNNFENLNSKHKMIILDMIMYMLREEIEGIPSELCNNVVSVFKNSSDCILKTESSKVDSLEAQEVNKLLECLCSLSSDEGYLPDLQLDKSLLISCIFLLKSIHAAGKANKNYFTPINSLTELGSSSQDFEVHPAFGFKANLIRLISNLVSDHKVNQDSVREAEGIPVLLDCCNIDARNPFITQWVIFAIRNLVKDNTDNMSVIAQMTKVGVIDSATLNQMGLVVNDDGTQKITVMPYTKPEN